LSVLAIGEVLWDVFSDRELLGGAPLNFAVTAQRLGTAAMLLTAVGGDQRGELAMSAMEKLHLLTAVIQTVDCFPTGTAVVTTDAAGNASYVIGRPAAFDRIALDEVMSRRIGEFAPDWLYFGTLAQTDPQNEAIVQTIVERWPRIRCFYDINLREGHWSLGLVQRLARLASILKLNGTEAELLHRLTTPGRPFNLEVFCRNWATLYDVDTLCVTLGREGCAVFAEDRLRFFPGCSVTVVDTVGAGDAFAAAYLHGLHQGWPIGTRAQFANAVGAVVATRAGAISHWGLEDVGELLASS
jgi:fructokinase